MQGTILVVEDSIETLEMVHEYLTQCGYQVFKAGDGLEALGLLEKQSVDIVLTDVRMPRMDGFALIKVLNEKYPKTGIVIMTAFTSIYSEGNIQELNVDDTISKPFNLNVLKEKIDRLYLQISILKEKNSE